ncbi:hypothetical protein [Psychrobacillus psychrodurans]|uniref:Uncharacterized protein n=1 Tax=Psychrobacillus psychrodurans TaxID=126157 RepID=A0A9X3L7L0_9BACI|nr:hypothetical protein [Psychrobacillus psychrodurans]MCZ8532645.1 hypothetical protein [Psychrobacillus psychrodurans]
MLTEMAWDYVTDKTVIFTTILTILLFGSIIGIVLLMNILSSKFKNNIIRFS